MMTTTQDFNTLKQDGVVVFPLLPLEKLASIRDQLSSTLIAFPEFVHTDPDKPLKSYVMGGFGALGNPSSFHNPFVRDMRKRAMTAILPIAKEFMHSSSSGMTKFEQLIDRLCIRPVGSSVTKEAWHRDHSPSAQPNDLIFGGWINFDDEPQYFSCVKGTQTPEPFDKVGFEVISKEEVSQNRYKERRSVVAVPPGHMIVFYQTIVHEVHGKAKRKKVLTRLFTGFRITSSSRPLIPDIHKRLNEFSVIPLKSDQIPPMYAKLHAVNWSDRLDTWSAQSMRKRCLSRVTNKKTKAKSKRVHRHMKSLMEYKLARICGYPKYSTSEKALYFPSTY